MILKVLSISLLLFPSMQLSAQNHDVKPGRSSLKGKASGGHVKRCTKECEKITEQHFSKIYGDICGEDTKNGQRILEKIRDYKAQLIMRRKGDPYIEEKDWKKKAGRNPEELKKIKARAVLDPEENAAVREELESIPTNCGEEDIGLISRFDMLNNSPRLTSKLKPKLNGVLAADQMDPFTYGIKCVAQCRDPEGLSSGRDEEEDKIYVSTPTAALKSSTD